MAVPAMVAAPPGELAADPSWPRVCRRLRVDPETGCWLWLGALNSAGYPVMKVAGQVVLVTRFMLAGGVRRFRRRELACHECDRPRCIRPHPEHVVHGSYSKNLRDAWSRRRRSRPSTFIEDS